jgi:hypothetical protein
VFGGHRRERQWRPFEELLAKVTASCQDEFGEFDDFWCSANSSEVSNPEDEKNPEDPPDSNKLPDVEAQKDLEDLAIQLQRPLYVARLIWLSDLRLHQPAAIPGMHVEKLVDTFYTETPYHSLYEACRIVFEAARTEHRSVPEFLAILDEKTRDRMLSMVHTALMGYIKLLWLRNPEAGRATAQVLGPMLDNDAGRKHAAWLLTSFKPMPNEFGEGELGRVNRNLLSWLFDVMPSTITQSNARLNREIRDTRLGRLVR